MVMDGGWRMGKAMLAYVFWHWPRPEVDRGEYEARLTAFQQALRAAAPAGFRESAVYRVRGLPWTAEAAYEEWYLLEGSEALDSLNDAAVSARTRAAHDAAAQQAAGGVAGLYRLRRGASELDRDRRAHWFAKPAGMSYEDLYTMLPQAPLWGRQMTLGPGPEFCLLAEAPPPFPALTVRCERV